MNKNDSEVLAGILERHGYTRIEGTEDADIILVNTCTVRQTAEDKAYGYISSLKRVKSRGSRVKVGICGCISQQGKSNLFTRFPFIDFVLGPNSLHELSNILANGKLQMAVRESCNPELRELPVKREFSTSAWISIIYGCDNFCSFCIVPYVRGRERSRSKESILKEIKGLDKNTYKEVILLGQNVNSYGKGTNYGLTELLRDIHNVRGVERIRFLTSHPRDMSDDIINAVKKIPKVCEFFHLPLQSGDNEILKRMNRGYASDHYRRLVEKIRSKIPDTAITSDVVVGFPGETEKQFEATCNIIKELELDAVNTAAYSIREGTAAAEMDGQLPDNIKQNRLQKIMKVVEETAWKVNQKLIGKTVEILVDGKGYSGRTRTNKIVKFHADRNDLLGKLVNVRIISAKSWVLEGEVNYGKF